MISFILALVALVCGYLFYGKFVEKVFGADGRPTPAVSKADGVDFIVLPSWKIFMIQFLNIAGTGPIFGAIMGSARRPTCGSFSAAFSQALCMIICPVCCPSGTAAPICPN